MKNTAKLLTLVFVMLFLCSTEKLGAVDIGKLTYSLSDMWLTATVTGLVRGESAASGDLVIPESVEYGSKTYSVTSIGSSAFYGCSGLTSITIPNSVTYIYPNAFYNCSGLTSVTIGNSVTIIGRCAFYGCSGLTSITIPNSVTKIDEGAFYGCSELTSITIPNSVTEIGGLAFDGCSGLKELTLEDGTDTLLLGTTYNGDSYSGPFSDCPLETLYWGRDLSYGNSNYAPFRNKTTLKSVTIGNSVTEIGRCAFDGCSELTSVTIGNSVTEIGDLAFDDCSELTSVTIGNSVTEIGRCAFYGCSGLTSITIPNSVTEIDMGAFYNCSGLTSITIPNSVKTIDDYTFYGCSGLKELTLEDGTETLSLGIFSNCPLETLYLGRNLSYYGRFEDKTTLTSVTIGNSITEIGSSAFRGCSITEIYSDADNAPTLSNSSFSDFTYNYCKVYIPKGSRESYKSKWTNFKYLMPDNPIKNTYTINTPGDLVNQINTGEIEDIVEIKLIGKINGTDILTMNKLVNLTSIDLSEATIVEGGMPYYESGNDKFGTQNNTLGRYWAYNLNILTAIVLPENLTTIGDYAFRNLAVLSKLEIPNSVTSIGKETFYGCSGLTSITLPGSITEIGNSAFYNCSGLTSITIPNSVTSIGESAFYNCSGLNSITIPNSVTSIGESAFSGCSGLTSLTIPNSVTEIGNSAFYNCSGLTSITIPNSITSIGKETFYNCAGLTSITIPNSVTSIGNSAFSGCSGLKELTLEDGNTTLSLGDNGSSEGLFSDCPLETLHLGRNYSSDYVLFSGKKTLKSLTIGNSVNEIGNYAFSGCFGLISLTIGNSVAEIGSSAFSGCSGLTSIILPGSVRSIGYSAFSNCSALTNITLINPIPAVIESNTFNGCTDQATLNVPDGSEGIYRNHPDWGQFKTINATAAGNDKKFVSDNVTYHITSELLGTVEISAANINSKSRAGVEVIIPEEMTFNNNVYTVAGIANNGFEGADISAITLPETISYVGLDAFKGCNNITSVTCLSLLPPSVDESSFEESVYGKATLVINPSAESAYKNDEVWSKFYALSPTGIDNIESETERAVRVEDGNIIAPEGSEVYDLNGRRVAASGLRPGIYIVRIPGGKAVKVRL